MENVKIFQERKVSGTQWFWFLTFMGLITRLPFLRLATAETTDGVLCLTYFSKELVQTPRFVILPGYPALLWAGQAAGLPGGFWGRLLAALAGLLFLIPLWKFCRRWMTTEMAGMVCLMALFFPHPLAMVPEGHARHAFPPFFLVEPGTAHRRFR